MIWSLFLASQEESFATNVARLKEYRANLIVFPRGSKHQPKAGDSSVEEQAAAAQVIFSTRNHRSQSWAALEFRAQRT